MKRIALLTLLLVSLATVAFGQAGHVTLYVDPGYTVCNSVAPVGVVTVYAVHEQTSGTKASQFMIQNNSGGAMLYLADQNNFQVIGSTNTGYAASYGACLTAPIEICRVLYQALFDPPTCSTLDIVPDPGALSGQIEGVSCASQQTFPTGGGLTFNADASCQCANPVEESNWGRVKALYN